MADVICTCPKCGGDIRRVRYNKDGQDREFIGCSNYKEKNCDFRGPFPTFMETKLSDAVLKELIEDGKTSKPVSIKIHLKMEDGRVRMDFRR